MRNAFAVIFVVVTIAISAVVVAQSPTNPQIDTIRRGLIQKLCDNAHGKVSSSTATTAKSARTTGTTPIIPLRSTRQQAGPAGSPTCNEFNSLTFEELIERNKALLKPVNTRRQFA